MEKNIFLIFEDDMGEKFPIFAGNNFKAVVEFVDNKPTYQWVSSDLRHIAFSNIMSENTLNRMIDEHNS